MSRWEKFKAGWTYFCLYWALSWAWKTTWEVLWPLRLPLPVAFKKHRKTCQQCRSDRSLSYRRICRKSPEPTLLCKKGIRLIGESWGWPLVLSEEWWKEHYG